MPKYCYSTILDSKNYTIMGSDRKSDLIWTIFNSLRPCGKIGQCTKFHQNILKIATYRLNTKIYGADSRWIDKFSGVEYDECMFIYL